MSNDGIRANPDSVERDGIDVVRQAAELEDEINAFDTTIKGGLNAIWSGSAVDELNNVYDEFKPVLDKFQELLDTKGNNIQKAGQNLRETEEENTRRVASL